MCKKINWIKEKNDQNEFRIGNVGFVYIVLRLDRQQNNQEKISKTRSK